MSKPTQIINGVNRDRLSSIISDADADTKIQTEESTDEDIIRFDTAGTERMILDENGVLLVKNKLAFTQTDFNENIDSVTDGFLDLTATTATRFNAAIANTDVVLQFVGTTNSGECSWMEDEDEFKFSDKVTALDFIKTGWPATTGVTLSFDNGTMTFTVTDGGSAFYYINGIRYTLGGNKTIAIDDVEGLWYIYFSGSTLTASQTPWVIIDDDKAFVAIVYWDATNNEAITLGYELHGHVMDADTHARFHDGGGSAWESGLLVSDAGSDTVNVSVGDFHDEDNEIDISDGAGAGLWEQVLSPAELPIFYRSGASAWRVYDTGDKSNATEVAYIDGGNDMHYNKLNGTWASVAAGINKYVAYYAIATPDQTEPVSLIMGQRIDNTLAAAKVNNVFSGLSLSGLPFTEMIVLARIIVHQTAGGNYYDIDEIVDLRSTNAAGNITSPLITDHGGLGGLGDDDHSQYILVDGTRAFTGNQSLGGNDITNVGSIGVTGTRATKLWATDVEVTNAIAGSITGNAATVTGFTPASGSLTLAGADALTITTTAGTGVTLPTTGTLSAIAGTETLTNKRITPRVSTEASAAEPTINTDNVDAHSITALATAVTSMTTNLSGTPTNFQKLIVRFLDNATGRAITWGASFEDNGVALPATTTASKLLTVGFIYDTASSKWGCVAVADET